ncbi:hypothetical protein [Prauserella flavalba]
MGAGHRNRVFHLMSRQPDRVWRPIEVAAHLDVPNIATQMNQWATEGVLRKVGYGKYTLADEWKTAH